MKRAIFLATAALLAMLLLAPMALAQGTTSICIDYCGSAPPLTTSSAPSSASASGVAIVDSGGPAILLPAAALLVGSGILTYAILRRR